MKIKIFVQQTARTANILKPPYFYYHPFPLSPLICSLTNLVGFSKTKTLKKRQISHKKKKAKILLKTKEQEKDAAIKKVFTEVKLILSALKRQLIRDTTI